MTTHAETAKAIKKELKKNFPNTKFKVTSESYSMGSSVNISWIDGETKEEIYAIIKKYQYGHFDGMQDLYEYSNSREDIPQVKYVMAQRELSEETIKTFIEEHNKRYCEEQQLPLNPSENFQYLDKWFNGYQFAWRELFKLNFNKMTIKDFFDKEKKLNSN